MSSMVSILCAMCNQKKCIGKALDKLANRETDPPFEVVANGVDATEEKRYGMVCIHSNTNDIDSITVFKFKDTHLYKKQGFASTTQFQQFPKRIKVEKFLRFPELSNMTGELRNPMKGTDSIETLGRQARGWQ